VADVERSGIRADTSIADLNTYDRFTQRGESG